MSLGGIAIAIGVLVDAGIVMTENVIRQAEQYERRARQLSRAHLGDHAQCCAARRPAHLVCHGHHHPRVHSRVRAHRDGRQDVPSPGIHQDLCHGGSTILAITLVPVLCTFLIRGSLHREDENPVMRVLRAIYQPVLRWALAASIAHDSLPRRSCCLPPPSTRQPRSDRSSCLRSMRRPPSLCRLPIRASLSPRATEIMRQQDRIIADDPAGGDGCRQGGTRRDIDRSRTRQHERNHHHSSSPRTRGPRGSPRMQSWPGSMRSCKFPASPTSGRSPFATASTCSRPASAPRSASRSSVPICASSRELSKQIKNVVRQIPGATDLYAERTTGSPYLEMTVDRPAANRYGLNVADVKT